MNERLKQLAMKAGIATGVYEWDEKFAQKLVELAIQDAINQINTEAFTLQEQTGMQSGWFAMGMSRAADIIKHNFEDKK
jgi:hypothetical protein